MFGLHFHTETTNVHSLKSREIVQKRRRAPLKAPGRFGADALPGSPGEAPKD